MPAPAGWVPAATAAEELAKDGYRTLTRRSECHDYHTCPETKHILRPQTAKSNGSRRTLRSRAASTARNTVQSSGGMIGTAPFATYRQGEIPGDWHIGEEGLDQGMGSYRGYACLGRAVTPLSTRSLATTGATTGLFTVILKVC